MKIILQNITFMMIGGIVGYIVTIMLQNKPIDSIRKTSESSNVGIEITSQIQTYQQDCFSKTNNNNKLISEIPVHIENNQMPDSILLSSVIVGEIIDTEILNEIKDKLVKSGQQSKYYDFITKIPLYVKNRNELLIDAINDYQIGQIEDQSSLDALLAEAKISHQRDPYNVAITSTVMDVMQNREDLLGAIDIAKDTLAYDQSNAFINYRMGLLYQQVGDNTNSDYYFNMAASVSESYRILIQRNQAESEVQDTTP